MARKAPAVAAAEQHEAAAARGLTGAFTRMRRKLAALPLADAVKDGPKAVTAAIPEHVTQAELVDGTEALSDAFVSGAKTVSALEGGGRRIDVSFDIDNPRTEDFLSSYRMNLIREIDAGTREGIEQVVADGMRRGTSGDEIARNIRELVGLTARQAQAVENFRAKLQNGQAVDNALRDRRFDPTISRAIDEGRSLTDEQIETMVGRYRERYLAYRSQVIARTETLRAANAGARVNVQDRIDSGALQGVTVKRFWLNAGDGKVRHSHVMIPRLNQNGVGMDENFMLPGGGEIAFPQDPSADPAETIQCRCSIQYKVIPEEEE